MSIRPPYVRSWSTNVMLRNVRWLRPRRSPHRRTLLAALTVLATFAAISEST